MKTTSLIADVIARQIREKAADLIEERGWVRDLIEAPDEKAADLIEERGWVRDLIEAPDGRLSMAGAIGVAVGFEHPPLMGTESWPPEALAVFDQLENEVKGKVHYDLARWEEEVPATADEVIAVLRGHPLEDYSQYEPGPYQGPDWNE